MDKRVSEDQSRIPTLNLRLQEIEELESWKNTKRNAVVIEVTPGLR